MSKTEHSPSKYEAFREKYIARVEYLIDDKKTYGVSQNEMAKELGVSGAAITGWKSGTFANGEMLIAMSQFFDVRIDWLLGLDDNDKSPRKRDLVAQTGLSEAALKNLIYINNKRLPIYTKELMSEFLASPHFLDLILSLYEYTVFYETLKNSLESYNDSEDEFNKDSLYASEILQEYKLLRYGKFDTSEKCMIILNEILPIDKTLSAAENLIQEIISKEQKRRDPLK